MSDGSQGFPIGWQTLSGSGEKVYARQGSFSRQNVPLLGVTYNDYQFVSNSHALSIAAYVSNGKLDYDKPRLSDSTSFNSEAFSPIRR